MNKRLFDFYNALNPTIATLYTYTHLTSMTTSSSEVYFTAPRVESSFTYNGAHEGI